MMKSFFEFLGFAFVFIFALTIGVKAMVEDDAPKENVSASAAEASLEFEIIPTFSTTSPALISAEGAKLSYVDEKGNITALFSKNSDQNFLIASITKLLSAIVARENIPNVSITVEKNILEKRGAVKKFIVGSSYSKDALFRALLIESNNDAAWMFAENYGLENFLGKMSEKAKTIGMNNSVFANPVGLDGGSDFKENLSSPDELSLMAKYIYENHSGIFETSRFKDTTIGDINGKNTYVASTTNELLFENDLGVTIIGGKTGETPKSGKNLLLVFKKDPFPGYFISVVLNSKDNFGDTRNLINEIAK